MPKRCLTSFLALGGFLPASGFWLGALSQIPPCAYRYTLLVGKPPFETSCLKETYLRIKNNEYSIPKVTKTTLSLHLFYLIPPPPSDLRSPAISWAFEGRRSACRMGQWGHCHAGSAASAVEGRVRPRMWDTGRGKGCSAGKGQTSEGPGCQLFRLLIAKPTL